MNNFKLLKKLLHYVGKHKVKIYYLIFLSLLGVGFEVLKPLPIKFIVDNVLSDHALSPGMIAFFNSFGGVPGKIPLLSICIGAMVVFVIGNACVSIYASHLTTKVCQTMVHELSIDLFDKVQRLSLSFYSKNKVGELLQRISGDVYVVYSLVASIILPAITALATLIGMFYIMATINVLLACIAISVVPALALLLYIFYKPMNDSTVEQYNLLGELSAFMQQSLSSIKIIQAYSNENYTRDKFMGHSKQYSAAYVRSTKISMIYVILTGVITGLATAVVIGVGAFNGLQLKISIGELFVFLGYIGALFGPVNSLSNTVATAVTIGARSKRIFELMDSQETVSEKANAIELHNVQGDIELQNVEFGYGKNNDSKRILKDFNLKVSAGQIVALVGQTGAGKTSLISLLLRFYDPWKGKILIDGKDISDVKIASLRSHIALVLQDSFIFPMSIKENIAFGNPDATLDEIRDAAKASYAHDFIMRLPKGYDTVASEGGVSLSGGEKQRISLARAFLRKSAILILDEPTSALDARTESNIFKALKKYSSGRTVFIISHRLSTIRNADMIITLKDGVIAEKGTHENLISQDKLYAELYKFQHV
ncbi:MAG TPA: ABC transporter ATP-binding protein [Segetibacter sp.]|nr:ABC transporter ATP-binding protein [Segetibacter sp.]